MRRPFTLALLASNVRLFACWLNHRTPRVSEEFRISIAEVFNAIFSFRGCADSCENAIPFFRPAQ